MERFHQALKLAAFGSIVALIGCDTSVPELKETVRHKSDGVAEETQAVDKQEIKLRATDLAKTFADDNAAATSNYAGKRVQLTGKIGAVPGQGGWYDRITFTGHEREGGVSLDIDCRLTPGEFERVKDLSVTQEVTLTGEVVGYSAEVVVSNCKLTNIGDDPAIEITAVELSQAYFENETVAEAKYENKPVKVTGKIAAFNDRELEIYLQGYETATGESLLIVLRLGVEFSKIKDQLSVGDTIVANGVGSTFLDGELELTHAHMLRKEQ